MSHKPQTDALDSMRPSSDRMYSEIFYYLRYVNAVTLILVCGAYWYNFLSSFTLLISVSVIGIEHLTFMTLRNIEDSKWEKWYDLKYKAIKEDQN